MPTYFNRIINFTGDFFVGVRVRVLEGTASLCSAVIKSVEHTHSHSLTRIQRIPVWAKLPQDEADKLPESIWKCGVYTVTWSWAAYLVLFGEKNLFTDLVAHWDCE